MQSRHYPAAVDLALVVRAIESRLPAWTATGASAEMRGPIGPASKQSASVRVETVAGMAEFVVWDTGEAEIVHVDLPNGDPVVEVCEVTSAVGLHALLDDVEGHVGLRHKCR